MNFKNLLIKRTFIGPQIEYQSNPEWYEVAHNYKRVTDLNFINAIEDVRYRSESTKSDISTFFKMPKSKVIIAKEYGVV
jgi:hypothetical protein